MKEIINKIFSKLALHKKSLLQPHQDEYSQKVELIDDLEIGRMFEKSITSDIKQIIQKYDKMNNIYNYPLQTQISKQHTLEIAKKFFSSIDEEIAVKINDIIDGNNTNIKLEMPVFNGKYDATVSNPDTKPIIVFVPIRNDLRYLYELVHELTHTLDTDNGDTITRKTLGEVAPQCMERMLDDFLIGMTNEEMSVYGFDKSILKKDIQDRQITTFISRYHNVLALNRGKGNRVLDSRYMLAQIYSAQFNKFNANSKKSKIKSFIDCVSKDDFDVANAIFGLKIARDNKLQRDFYVSNTLNEIRSITCPKNNQSNLNIEKSVDTDAKEIE